MPDIFISYKREDRDNARSLAEYFATHGYDVWWDIDLLPGDVFANEINAALNQAKAVIVLWTPLAIKSNYVMAEASHARDRNILIPTKLKETKIPVPFNVLQTLDLINWSGEIEDPILLTLLEAVNKLVDEPSFKNTTLTNANVDGILQKPEDELALWKSIIEKEEPTVNDYQLYMNKYDDSGWFSKIAQRRIDEIKEEESISHGIRFTLNPKVVFFLIFSVCTLIFLLNIDNIFNREINAPIKSVEKKVPAKSESSTDQNAQSDLTKLLNECDTHLNANRLTIGNSGNAYECYTRVLEIDGKNKDALNGLTQIEDRYVQRAKSQLAKNNSEQAQKEIQKLKKINPEHASLSALQIELIKKINTLQDPASQNPVIKEEAMEKEEESILWANTKNNDSFESYVNYLKKFPYGNYSKMAQLRIQKREQAYWKEVQTKNTTELYQQFIKFYPFSNLSRLAKFRLAK